MACSFGHCRSHASAKPWQGRTGLLACPTQLPKHEIKLVDSRCQQAHAFSAANKENMDKKGKTCQALQMISFMVARNCSPATLLPLLMQLHVHRTPTSGSYVLLLHAFLTTAHAYSTCRCRKMWLALTCYAPCLLAWYTGSYASVLSTQHAFALCQPSSPASKHIQCFRDVTTLNIRTFSV